MIKFPLNFFPQQPQEISVIIEIRGGNFADGFPIILQVLKQGKRIYESESGEFRFPPMPRMRELYENWQIQSLEGSRWYQSRIKAVQAQVVNVSNAENLNDWKQTTKALEDYCKEWFKQDQFRFLGDRIINKCLNTSDSSIPIIIRTHEDNPDGDILSRLPFHLWDLYTRLVKAEFALFNRFHHFEANLKRSIKVLAIVGTSEGGLNLEKDTQAIQSLEKNGAYLTLLKEPDNETLFRHLSDQTWDILFFAGHSSSEGNTGQIQIRNDQSLSLDNLRLKLKDAVHKGLKLAIFNSCDGLGIAKFLKEAEVQNIIVMKEPVPDNIACLFLTEFLREFTKGTQLCQSIRQARSRIELEQEDFPAASWLPIVFLNPTSPELTLPQSSLVKKVSKIISDRRTQIALGTLLFAGLVTTTWNNRCNLTPKIGGLTQIVPSLFQTCSIQDFISRGDRQIKGSKIILPSESQYFSLKKAGIDAFKQDRDKDAMNFFDTLREKARQNLNNSDSDEQILALTAFQDPEVLIYRNNAQARMNHAENPNSSLYTIATVAPMNIDPGMDILRGVAQAQDVAVKNGLNLEIMIANDLNNTQQARKIAQEISQNQDILAVIGHYTSPNTCEGLKVYALNKLPLIAPTSTMVSLAPICGDPEQHFFFRTVSNTNIEAKTLIEYLINDLKVTQPKIVVFYNSKELFSNDMFDQFKLRLGGKKGKIIKSFDLSDYNLNRDQFISDVKDADAIALLPDGGTNGDMVLNKSIEILQLNNGKKLVLGANTLYLPKVLQQGKDALINSLFIAIDWHPNMCGAEQFSEDSHQYWGESTNRRSALAYEAIQLIGSVLPKTGNQIVTRDYVREKLAQTGIDGIAPQSDVFKGQTISVDEKGERKEITTRRVVTVNQEYQFILAKDSGCLSR